MVILSWQKSLGEVDLVVAQATTVSRMVCRVSRPPAIVVYLPFHVGKTDGSSPTSNGQLRQIRFGRALAQYEVVLMQGPLWDGSPNTGFTDAF